MALRKPTNTATSAAQFEDETLDAVAETASDAVAQAAPAASTSTAVAAARPTAVATARSVTANNVISTLKDAFPVEFDSLPRIAAEQGAFVFKDDSEEEVGAAIKLQLLSYQDSWVCSPNDKKADVDLVKWSDDGVTSKDGIDLKTHLQDLIEQGYTKAKIQHRCIIVGELLEGDTDRLEELVQLDLPESGRRSFNTYQLQASYAVAKGKKTEDDAKQVTLTAVKAKTASGEVYTKIVVS